MPGGGDIVGSVGTEPWKGIKDGAVVYIEDAPREPGAGMSAIISGRDMNLEPHIAVLTAGGTVTFTNTDPVGHAIFSPDDDSFETGTVVQHQAVAQQFDRPAAYALLCRCHPSMEAFLVVSPSSYFAKTGTDGTFAIRGVPKGTYKVTAWAPRFKPQTKTVALDEGQASLSFNLHR